MTSEKKIRDKPIPDDKKETVKNLISKITGSRTVLLASCKNLPGQQFHEIKKKLRGRAEIKIAKKSSIERAIDGIDKGAVKNLKKHLGADLVLMFSDVDPFELSGILADNQSKSKAKPGDVSPENIEIEPGLTELIPGPAISELGSVGLKVSVKEGKLEIIKGAVVVKKGEQISAKVASVLGKLDINPMKVGFKPLVAYDSKEDKIYSDIKIDKEGALQALREMLGKALGFAIKVEYPVRETISYLISKAASEEKALGRLLKGDNVEEKKEEELKEPKPENAEEKKDESREESVDTVQKNIKEESE